MSDATRRLAAARYTQGLRLRRRSESLVVFGTFLNPKFRVTPAIRLLSDLAVRWVALDQRDIVSTSPRTGKSDLLANWTVVWSSEYDTITTGFGFSGVRCTLT